LDRSTLRRIEENTSVSFSAKWKQAQKYADHIPGPLDNLRKNLAKASKILLLDGKYVNILGESVCVHIAFDTHIGAVDFWIDETENKTAYTYLLRRLKDFRYEPICVVSDDNSSITSLLAEEKIPHQLCIFHLLKTLRKLLTRENWFTSEIPVQYLVMYSRIKGIFKTTKIEELPDRINQFRKLQKFWQSKTHKYALDWFWSKLPNAVMCLSFEENVPRTNNYLENINNQIEARLKTFRGVKSEKSLNKILKILFYLRNFK
jgi:transposase-like protein